MRGEDTGVKEMESKQDKEMPETEAAKVDDDREEVGKEQDHCLEDADVDMLDAQSADKNEGEGVEMMKFSMGKKRLRRAEKTSQS